MLSFGLNSARADVSLDADLQPLWESAVASLKSQNNAEAVEQFSRWIATARADGIESPEAYYNLALAEWSLSRIDRAMSHFVRSAALVSSPLENWRNLQLLARLEREAGIKESATGQLSFKLKMILNSNVSVALFMTGFWIFVLLSVWRWWRAERGHAIASLRWVLATPVLLWSLAAVGFFNLKLGHTYAVLSDKTEVALFSTPDDKEKIIELPAGTIIESGKEENGYVQVLEPVSGWARTSQINPLQFPDIGAPEVAFLRK
jgi:hypothetical protein